MTTDKDARIAELEAALHIATNDKLSLLDQLDREKQARMARIDYGCDLQRIIEDLCRGGPIREPKTSARHHYNMAVEALSRTGAVKVKALEWEERKTRLGTVWWSAPNPLGGLSIEAASESDKIAAQADYERRILSALEPAAPEGRQEDEPRAYIVHAPEDDYYGTGPDRLQFHPLAQHDMDNGYRQTPLYTRPSEQAVTEAKPVAFRVHDFHVARIPVKARGKFDEPTEYFYPASRENDARETARIMGATCTPLYAGKESE